MENNWLIKIAIANELVKRECIAEELYKRSGLLSKGLKYGAKLGQKVMGSMSGAAMKSMGTASNVATKGRAVRPAINKLKGLRKSTLGGAPAGRAGQSASRNVAGNMSSGRTVSMGQSPMPNSVSGATIKQPVTGVKQVVPQPSTNYVNTGNTTADQANQWRALQGNKYANTTGVPTAMQGQKLNPRKYMNAEVGGRGYVAPYRGGIDGTKVTEYGPRSGNPMPGRTGKNMQTGEAVTSQSGYAATANQPFTSTERLRMAHPEGSSIGHAAGGPGSTYLTQEQALAEAAAAAKGGGFFGRNSNLKAGAGLGVMFGPGLLESHTQGQALPNPYENL